LIKHAFYLLNFDGKLNSIQEFSLPNLFSYSIQFLGKTISKCSGQFKKNFQKKAPISRGKFLEYNIISVQYIYQFLTNYWTSSFLVEQD